ncbi:MAG: hypothetical protein K2I86_05790 [Prevotella sp.]|nr:hypothetical protein [Prevotella sp.]
MEEKSYPQFDEEQGVDMACEPVGTVLSSVNSVTGVCDRIDGLDWNRFPSYGPFSEEEAIARIDQFEEQLEKGKIKWISSEEAWAQLYEQFPWLR